jgi:glycosyltransferase involved in cell wall biosynthesis
VEGLESKRIAVFLPSLVAGGVGRVFVDLANGFSARGCAVDLVLGRATGPHLARVDSGVEVIELERDGLVASRRLVLAAHPGPVSEILRSILVSPSGPASVRSLPSLVRYLEAARPDAMLSGKTHTNLAALWAACLTRVPTRVVVSERTHLSRQMSMKREPRWREIAPAVGRMYPLAQAITSVSDGVSDDLARVTGIDRARIETIYNPIDTKHIRALAAEPADHRWLQNDPKRGLRVILGAGRLSPQKDFASLLTAFAALVSERDDTRTLRLIILGEGDERGALEARVHELRLEDHVDLPGFVENPYRFMGRAAAFVLSSAWEGLPSALTEAIVCGCPVVSTDCPSGPREILADGKYGSLVPVGDPGALADALGQVLDHPTDPALLAQRASDFEAEAAIDRYLRVLLFN